MRSSRLTYYRFDPIILPSEETLWLRASVSYCHSKKRFMIDISRLELVEIKILGSNEGGEVAHAEMWVLDEHLSSLFDENRKCRSESECLSLIESKLGNFFDQE